MITDTKEETLTNSASKFEALLYQFIKLYDRLTVEHNLITERELKIVTKLEKLDQTLKELDLKLVTLDQLSPQIKTESSNAINAAVSNNWTGLSKNITANAQQQVTLVCDSLWKCESSLRCMVEEYKDMKKSFSLKIWVIIFLLGLIIGAVGSYCYLKEINKCIVVDLEVYKKLQKKKD